jgi:predicted nucleotidyltransferase
MSGLKEIENQITKYKEQLREKFNVKKIGIFGSYSRGEERINSDVDILVEFIESPGWEFYDLKEFLEEILGKKVDLITENGLRLQMKHRILNEVIYI